MPVTSYPNHIHILVPSLEVKVCNLSVLKQRIRPLRKPGRALSPRTSMKVSDWSIPEAKPLKVAQPDPLLHMWRHRPNGLQTHIHSRHLTIAKIKQQNAYTSPFNTNSRLRWKINNKGSTPSFLLQAKSRCHHVHLTGKGPLDAHQNLHHSHATGNCTTYITVQTHSHPFLIIILSLHMPPCPTPV